jgi:deoxycytidylate deaminase
MNPSHLSLALKLAQKGVGKYRLGAVLARRKKVVSIGWNHMYKSHPAMMRILRNIDWTPGLHAEVKSCLGVAMSELRGAEMYVGRILRNGNPAMARPCGLCQSFLREVGIRKVYYSMDAGVGRMTLGG